MHEHFICRTDLIFLIW